MRWLASLLFLFAASNSAFPGPPEEQLASLAQLPRLSIDFNWEFFPGRAPLDSMRPIPKLSSVESKLLPKLESNPPGLLIDWALALQKTNRAPEARKAFDAAYHLLFAKYEHGDRSIGTVVDYSKALKETGRPAESVKVLQTFLEKNPRVWEAEVELANRYSEESVELLYQAAGTKPPSVVTHVDLGKLLSAGPLKPALAEQAIKSLALARDCFVRAEKTNPKSAEFHLAEYYFFAGLEPMISGGVAGKPLTSAVMSALLNPLTRQIIDRGLKLDPRNRDLRLAILTEHVVKVAYYGSQGLTEWKRLPPELRVDMTQNFAVLNAMAAKAAADDRSWFYPTLYLETAISAPPELTRPASDLALKQGPPDQQAFEILMGCLDNEQRYPESVALARAWIQRDPSPRNRYFLARALDKNRQFADEEELIVSIRKKEPAFAPARLAEATLALRQFPKTRDLTRAGQILDELEKEDLDRPTRRTLEFNRGLYLALKGDRGRALKIFEEFKADDLQKESKRAMELLEGRQP